MIAREQLEQVRGELAVGYVPPTCRPFLAAPPGRATLGQPEAVEPPRAVAEGRLLRKAAAGWRRTGMLRRWRDCEVSGLAPALTGV
jgi:hypothetical protein